MNFENIRGYWRLKQLKNSIFEKTLHIPKFVECNICNWQGRRFLDDFWHKKVMCPNCASDIRHRLLHMSLKSFKLKDKKILHFAPENCLKPFFYNLKEYITADLNNFENLDLKIDISDMSEIPNDEFDIVIASDVLEHVYNDKKAIAEIYRILKVNGLAVITVPQSDEFEHTIEDLSSLSKKEREKKFGNFDHYRIYGSDFKKTLENGHFRVKVFEAKSYDEKISKYYVLKPPKLNLNPIATNRRRIYHAYK